VAVLLVAPPVFAAPSPDSGVPTHVVQLLADWWGALTQTLMSVFAADGGLPTFQATDDPTGGTENRAGYDPNG
jgi:hypothetical protein